MRYWLVGLVVVAVLLVFGNAMMAWRVDASFAAKVAAIRAAGDPASIADLKPKRIPDADNAAIMIDRMRPRLKAFDAAYDALLKSPPFAADVEKFHDGEPMSSEQTEAVATLLTSFADVEPLIAQAAACDQYASTANFSLSFQKFLDAQLPRVQDVRAAARLMSLRMRLLVGEGRRDEAVARGIDVLRISRLYEQEPGLTCFLVSIAVRGVAIRGIAAALEAGAVPAAMQAALDEELARLDDPAKLQRAMRLERALSVSATEEQVGQATSGASRLFGWTVKRQFSGPLEYYEALMPQLNQPWHDMKGAGVTSTLTALGKYGTLATLLAPAVTATVDAGRRDAALVRSLRVLNGLQQFAEANGRQPAGLADVGLAPAATSDPYTGAPLLVKRTDRGWVVYSVYRNRKDDGGDFSNLNGDVGVGPAAVGAE